MFEGVSRRCRKPRNDFGIFWWRDSWSRFSEDFHWESLGNEENIQKKPWRKSRVNPWRNLQWISGNISKWFFWRFHQKSTEFSKDNPWDIYKWMSSIFRGNLWANFWNKPLEEFPWRRIREEIPVKLPEYLVKCSIESLSEWTFVRFSEKVSHLSLKRDGVVKKGVFKVWYRSQFGFLFRSIVTCSVA